MRAVLLCLTVLVCALAPAAAAVAQTATTPPPVATTGLPPVTSTAPPATATTPAPVPVEINVPAAEDDSGPAPLVVGLIVLVALGLIVGLAWAFLRLTAWEPTWLPRLRHAIGEAGYRLGGAWAAFRDWFNPRWR